MQTSVKVLCHQYPMYHGIRMDCHENTSINYTMLDLDSWMGGAVLTIVYMLKVSLEKTKAIKIVSRLYPKK